MKKLAIYGASHFNVLKTVDAINRAEPTWEIVGFVDDTPDLKGKMLRGFPVLGGRDAVPGLADHADMWFCNNVISHWKSTQTVGNILDAHHCRVATLIHPLIYMNYVEIGRGCLIPEGCVVGSGTVIGDFVNLRLGVIVSHDVTIGDYAFIGPGTTIGSGVVLETCSYIGAGVTVMLDRRIGSYSIVGAGAVVTRDVRNNVTVVGVPAKETGEGSARAGEQSD